MAEVQKLLTIAIPTYNRSEYLKRLLGSISNQIFDHSSDIEIIIFDNASTDNTRDVVNTFLKDVPSAKYILNESNLGMDGNFRKCFESASAKYFWMIGDDDFLDKNAISNILDVLKRHSSSTLVYVSSTIKNDNTEDLLDYEIIKSSKEFVQRVGIMFTFISGVICNKDAYLSITAKNKPEMAEGSFLMHMYWQLPLLKNGEDFVIINNKMIYSTPDNSGGYRIFQVFAKNLSTLLDLFYNRKDYASKKIRNSAAIFLLNFLNNSSKTHRFQSENYIEDCDFAFNDLIIYRYFLRFFYVYPFFMKFLHQTKPLIKKVIRK